MSAKKREPWNPLLCSYPESEKVNHISIGAETMFTRLIAKCDDNGNYWGSAKMLLCGLFAKRFEQGQVNEKMCLTWLDEIVSTGLVQVYECTGTAYLHVENCKKHLRVDINRDERFPQQGQNADTYPDTTADTPSSYTTTDTTTDTPKPRKGACAGGVLFDRFWTVYPKKVAKDAARKAFAKRNPDEVLLAKMLAAIEAQKRADSWKQDGGRYIPHPVTWLNQERWEDVVGPMQSARREIVYKCYVCGRQRTESQVKQHPTFASERICQEHEL